MNAPLPFLFVATFLAASGGLSLAQAAALDELQGQWSLLRTNSEGQLRVQSLQFKGDRLEFQVMDGDRQVLFVARGRAQAQRQSPFQVLRVTEIEAGQSADDLQRVDDERVSIYALQEDALFIASNFDKARDNQSPRSDVYRRGMVSIPRASPPGLETKLAGEWNMELTMNDNTIDYRLLFARGADGAGWRGTLISPRSGEYEFKSVRVQENQLTLEITRTFDGNDVPFLYKAKLNGDALEGTVVVPGAENQFNGTWKARK